MNERVQRRMRLLSNLAADERAPDGERAAARARLAALQAKYPAPAPDPNHWSSYDSDASSGSDWPTVNVTFGSADLDDLVGSFTMSGRTASGARWTMYATRPPRSR